MSAMHAQPTGAAFDIVLLLHVGCVVAGLATTVALAASASRLRRCLLAGSPIPDTLLRYFQSGVNWAGRVLYGVPIFGFTLLAMSQGAYSAADDWVTIGLVIFVMVAVVGEITLWPAERRIQRGLARLGAPAPAPPGSELPRPEPRPWEEEEQPTEVRLIRDAALVVRTGAAMVILLVVASAIMLAQP
jgi:hypothetical protein